MSDLTLASRTVASLAAQRAALLADWKHWEERVKRGGPLEQHNSQFHRVKSLLEGVLPAEPKVGEGLAAFSDLAEPRLAFDIVHLIWGFFRDKLVQREDTRLARLLTVADDLAWACYHPFQQAYAGYTEASRKGAKPEPPAEDLKSPPLVFHVPERSPFAQSRESSFDPPGLADEDTGLFRDVLASLPVPIIGLPGPHMGRVPPLALLFHEVGHVVGADLGLLRVARRRLDARPLGDRKSVWKRWLDEVFADVFGVVTGGISYVDQLATFLVGSLSAVRNEPIVRKGSRDNYPTSALRMTICREAFEAAVDKQGPGASSACAAWSATYGDPGGEAANYAKDVPTVVDAILEPYAELGTAQQLKRSFVEVLPVTDVSEEKVGELAGKILQRHDAGRRSIRTWVAAAARAHRDQPQTYLDGGRDAWVVNFIYATRDGGVRSDAADALRARLAPDPAAAAQLAASDETRGRALALRLGWKR